MRYKQTLQAPLRLRALLQRDRPCNNHFLVLAKSATPPHHPGGLMAHGLATNHTAVCPQQCSICCPYLFQGFCRNDLQGQEGPCVGSYSSFVLVHLHCILRNDVSMLVDNVSIWYAGFSPIYLSSTHLKSQRLASDADGDDALWVTWNCGMRMLQLPDQVLGANQLCTEFGSIGVTLELGPTSAVLTSDGCPQLTAWHSLGSGPFYLFLGANCSSSSCPGEAPDLRQQIHMLSVSQAASTKLAPSLCTARPYYSC